MQRRFSGCLPAGKNVFMLSGKENAGSSRSKRVSTHLVIARKRN